MKILVMKITYLITQYLSNNMKQQRTTFWRNSFRIRTESQRLLHQFCIERQATTAEVQCLWVR